MVSIEAIKAGIHTARLGTLPKNPGNSFVRLRWPYPSGPCISGIVKSAACGKVVASIPSASLAKAGGRNRFLVGVYFTGIPFAQPLSQALDLRNGFPPNAKGKPVASDGIVSFTKHGFVAVRCKSGPNPGPGSPVELRISYPSPRDFAVLWE